MNSSSWKRKWEQQKQQEQPRCCHKPPHFQSIHCVSSGHTRALPSHLNCALSSFIPLPPSTSSSWHKTRLRIWCFRKRIGAPQTHTEDRERDMWCPQPFSALIHLSANYLLVMWGRMSFVHRQSQSLPPSNPEYLCNLQH